MADEKGGVCSVHTTLHSKNPSHRFQGYVQNLVGLPQSTDIFWSSQSLLERERYAPTCCCAKGLKLVCWNIMLDAAESINTLSQVSFSGISSSKSSCRAEYTLHWSCKSVKGRHKGWALRSEPPLLQAWNHANRSLWPYHFHVHSTERPGNIQLQSVQSHFTANDKIIIFGDFNAQI